MWVNTGNNIIIRDMWVVPMNEWTSEWCVRLYTVFHKKTAPFSFFHNSVEWRAIYFHKIFSCGSWKNTNSKYFNRSWLLVKFFASLDVTVTSWNVYFVEICWISIFSATAAENFASIYHNLTELWKKQKGCIFVKHRLHCRLNKVICCFISGNCIILGNCETLKIINLVSNSKLYQWFQHFREVLGWLSVQHGHPSLQWFRLIDSETLWLLDLCKTRTFHFLWATLYIVLSWNIATWQHVVCC